MIFPLLVHVVVAESPFARILENPALRGATIAAIVLDRGGRVVFAKEADRRVLPASNQKLFTAAYALDTLGPEHRGTTLIARVGDEVRIQSDGTLDLSYEKLKLVADQVGRGSRVLLAQSYRRGRPDSWSIGDAPNRYAPFISAFTCASGGMELWAKDGSPELRPAAFGVRIERREESGFTYDPFRGVVTVGPLEQGERRLDTLSQPAADLAAAGLFGDDVRLVPTVDMEGTTPTKILSASIAEVLPRCLPPSDNFLAESLFEMTRAGGKSPASWAAGIGLAPNDYSPVDGSGLSRKDAVTANGIAHLLRYAARRPWGGLFQSSLARPGIGTLRNRLKGVEFAGKTGSLDGVSALAGYVGPNRAPSLNGGRPLADHSIVAIVVNQFTGPVARIHAIQDEFVRAAARL